MKQLRQNSNRRSKESSLTRGQVPPEEAKQPQMKKVGQFLIDMDRHLGEGQYGKVYLSQEIVDPVRTLSNVSQMGNGSNGASITRHQPDAIDAQNPRFYACKVVERQQLCQVKESLVVSEIQNQDAVQSKYVVKMRKAIKTDARYYIFMEFCNGSDLKEIMEFKKNRLSPQVIQMIM
jgi:serine/threonine protein kinase